MPGYLKNELLGFDLNEKSNSISEIPSPLKYLRKLLIFVKMHFIGYDQNAFEFWDQLIVKLLCF